MLCIYIMRLKYFDHTLSKCIKLIKIKQQQQQF